MYPSPRRLDLPIALATLLVLLPLGCCTNPGSADDPPATARAATGPVDYSHYDHCLTRHLRGGLYNYAAHLADAETKARWSKHLEVMASVDAGSLPLEDEKAFWTNAYNTFCIEGILRNYPTKAPNVIEGYFDKQTYRCAGQSMTVNAMQYETLMPKFQDARLHFVLVCADFGCLPLEKTAFTGADLEARLGEASYRFARDAGRFRIDLEQKKVYASKLFDADWYAKDFTGDPARPAEDAVRYMAPWLTPAERALLESGDYTVEIIPWDWRLNEWREETK